MSETTPAATPQAGEGGQPQAGATTTEPTTPQAGNAPGQAPEPQTVESLPRWAQDTIKDLRKEQAANRKRLDEIEATQRKADEDAAAKRGEFEQLAGKRADERDAAIAERDALKARLDAIDAERAAAIESGVKEFPKDLPALAFDPGKEADLDARWRWFQTAVKQASEAPKPIVRGNGRDPIPLHGEAASADDRAAREAQERRLRRAF